MKEPFKGPDSPRTRAAIAMYRNGRTVEQIAEELGCTRQAVHGRLRSAGVRLRPRGKVCKPRSPLVAQRATGAVLRIIAEQHGVTPPLVYHRLWQVGANDVEAAAEVLALHAGQWMSYVHAMDRLRLDHDDSMLVALEEGRRRSVSPP